MSITPMDVSSTSKQVIIETKCQGAAAFVNQYAMRCAPTSEKDRSYTTTAIKILSVSPEGIIRGKSDLLLNPYALSRSFNDNNWRGATPEQAPKAFLKNQCHKLSEEGEQADCLRQVKKIGFYFPGERIGSLSGEKPLECLAKQCASKATAGVASCQGNVQLLKQMLSKVVEPTRGPQGHQERESLY